MEQVGTQRQSLHAETTFEKEWFDQDLEDGDPFSLVRLMTRAERIATRNTISTRKQTVR